MDFFRANLSVKLLFATECNNTVAARSVKCICCFYYLVSGSYFQEEVVLRFVWNNPERGYVTRVEHNRDLLCNNLVL